MKTSHNTQGMLFPDDDGIAEKSTRSLLDHLLTESKLYKTGEACEALLAFVVRMKNFAPFNAMLIHIHFLKTHTTVDDLEIYQIMRAAGQIEALLGLTAHTRYEKPSSASQPSLDSTPTQAMLFKGAHSWPSTK